MSHAASLVSRLAQANIDPDLLSEVAEALFAGEIETRKLNERRQHDRERKAAQRSRDVTGQDGTGCDPSPLEVSPQTPLPKPPNQSAPLNPPKSRAKKAVSIQAPEWMPVDPWLSFVAMRERMHTESRGKIIWSEDAAKGVIAKLDRLRREGHCPIKLLEKAVVSSHRTVFEDESTKAAPGRGVPSGMTAAQWRERAEFYDKVQRREDAAECRRKAAELERQAA